MGRAWLGLGASTGNPPAQLAEAIRRLEEHPDIAVVAASQVISDGGQSHRVIAIETSLKPMALLDACLGIEAVMGRVHKEVWAAQLIDIDIIAFDDIQIRAPRLNLPHAFAHQRAFVLDPLREIAPEIAEWVVGINTRPR